MTTAALPLIPTSPVGNRIVQVAVDVVEGINEGRKMAWRYEQLSRLSNAELARLGLTRYDSPRAAVNGIAGF